MVALVAVVPGRSLVPVGGVVRGLAGSAPRSALTRRAARRPRMPSRPDDPAAEGGGQLADRAADAAQANHADGDVAQLDPDQRLPRPLPLQLEELGQAPADREDHEEDVLGDRRAEHATGVGDHDAAPAGLRGEQALDPGRCRMDPAQVRGATEEPLIPVAREEAAQEDLDVVDRPVGQAIARDHHQPRPGRRGQDALEILGR